MYGTDWMKVLRFRELFSRAMQQADVRIGALDHFAVEFEHEAQHTVRGRVLRTEIERVVLDLCHGVLLVFQTAIAVLADHARRDFARLDRHRLIDDALLFRVVTHFDVAGDREILAERMTDETVVGQDAAQVRVTPKTMPNRSNASRSYQLAELQISTTDATIGTSSSGANTRRRRRQLFCTDNRCRDGRETRAVVGAVAVGLSSRRRTDRSAARSRASGRRADASPRRCSRSP